MKAGGEPEAGIILAFSLRKILFSNTLKSLPGRYSILVPQNGIDHPGYLITYVNSTPGLETFK